MTKKRKLAIDAWLKSYFADTGVPPRIADYETSRNHRRTIVERDAQGMRIATMRYPGGKGKKMNRLPRGCSDVWTARILCATHRKRIRAVLGSPNHYPADRLAYESARRP
jgi:hypothetical protein